tara:strand:+ start:6349 stop:6534 length:186 start_codon:yes stop_codon:yes gene_type:complete
MDLSESLFERKAILKVELKSAKDELAQAQQAVRLLTEKAFSLQERLNELDLLDLTPKSKEE